MLEKYAKVRKLKEILKRKDEIQSKLEFYSDLGFTVYFTFGGGHNPLKPILVGVGAAKSIYDAKRMDEGKKPVLTSFFEYIDQRLRLFK
jgi:hypothetical protein